MASVISWLEQQLDDDGRPKRSECPFWEFVTGAVSLLKPWLRSLPEEAAEPLRLLLFFGLGHAAEELRGGEHEEWAKAALELAKGIGAADLEHLIRLIKSSKKARLGPKWSDLSSIASYAHPKQIVGCLREGWVFPTTALQMDHSICSASTALKLSIEGRRWIAPNWTLEGDAAPTQEATRARWQTCVSTSEADLLEWSFRSGTARITRTALMLKQHKLLLLADQVDQARGQSWTSSLGVDRLVRAESGSENRGLRLQNLGQSSLCLWPLGLPSLPYETERGRFCLDGSQLKLTQVLQSTRSWIPLMFSWDASRNRKSVHWRPLTVSESFKKCKPETAFAVRVAIKGQPSLVLYRSLGKPARRALLGHQTIARMMVGQFDSEGSLKPIFELE